MLLDQTAPSPAHSPEPRYSRPGLLFCGASAGGVLARFPTWRQVWKITAARFDFPIIAITLKCGSGVQGSLQPGGAGLGFYQIGNLRSCFPVACIPSKVADPRIYPSDNADLHGILIERTEPETKRRIDTGN
jgi:hypothetical protein